MQAPTHIVTGMLLQSALRRVEPKPLRYGLLFATGLISHGILDRIARLTYHPPKPLWNDWFWLVYHTGIAVVTTYCLVRFWREYKIGIIAATLPDFDWLVLHSAAIAGVTLPLYNDQIMHSLIYSIVDRLPLIDYIKYLPEQQMNRATGVFEFVLLAGLVAATNALNRGQLFAHSVQTVQTAD